MTAMPPPQDPALNVTTAGVPLRVLVSVRNLPDGVSFALSLQRV